MALNRKPPPSGPQGRGHVSPLGNTHIRGGGQVLRGGGSSGPLVKTPLKYREREEPVTRPKGNNVNLV